MSSKTCKFCGCKIRGKDEKCPVCGTEKAKNTENDFFQQVYFYANSGSPYCNAYPEQPKHGREWGIASMVLGISGIFLEYLVYYYFTIVSLGFLGNFFLAWFGVKSEFDPQSDYFVVLICLLALLFIVSVSGVVTAFVARKKGYKRGFTIAGMITSFISLACFCFWMFIFLKLFVIQI